MKFNIKQFMKLIDALKYRTHCPLCQKKLCINDRNLAEKYDIGNTEQRIAFELTSSDEIIYINPLTNEIELVIWDAGIKTQSGKRGIFGHSLNIKCNKCEMYDFTLQIWMDIDRQILTGMILNSEKISWEDKDNVLHEIASLYTTHQTKYSYFGADHSKNDGQITIPLVPLDVYNPGNTVARIRKLLIFS